MVSRTKVNVFQPRGKSCDHASEHTPIIYELPKAIIHRSDRRRIMKSILNNVRHVDRALLYYENTLPSLINEMKEAGRREVQPLHEKGTGVLLRPWQDIVDSKPRWTKPYWTKHLKWLQNDRGKVEAVGINRAIWRVGYL